jgi:predicted aspartyl protease
MAPGGCTPHLWDLINRRSFLTQAAFVATGAAGVWYLRDHVIWRAPKATYLGGAASSGWLRFSADEPRIVIVAATVNGAPVRALLDSGAQSSVIDRALAERLGLSSSPIAPVLAYGVSGGPQIGRSTSMDLEAGALRLEGLRAAVLDLDAIASASGRPFDLILGQDMLRTVIADVDFPLGRLAFHDPSRHTIPEGALATPARTDGRELLVPITIESRPLEVVLDTGASGALALSPQSAELAGLLDGRPVGAGASITFGGVSQNRVVTADTLAFAGVEHTDVRVHIYTPGQGARIPPGLLGVEVLEGFRTIIDLGQGRLHLIPGPPRPRQRPQRRRRRRQPPS